MMLIRNRHGQGDASASDIFLGWASAAATSSAPSQKKDVIFPCLPGEGRDLLLRWGLAFAGMTG
jgi:hypothetical protein